MSPTHPFPCRAHSAAGLLAAALAVAAGEAQAGSRVPSGFEDVAVVAGLAKPTAMAFAPDGRVFVAEQEGRLRIVRDGELLASPFVSLPVDWSVERGLLGVEVAPDFPTSGEIYVYYTLAGDTPTNRVSRFTASAANPDVADPASELVVLDGIPSAPFHNGGTLRFLPDGTLLVAVGDDEVPETAQSLEALTGKLLRLEPTGGVPADNPFARQTGARGEVWALGLRNPFSFAVEPGTGRVLINDVGLASTEEIDLGAAGANYGWPACEGSCSSPGFTDPVYQYNHSQGCAITGAAFAEGLRFPPEYGGSYFFSDFCGRWIRHLSAAGEIYELASDMDSDAVALGVGSDGALHYLSYGAGELRRIEFVGEGNHRPVAVAEARPAAGPAPLAVVLAGDASHDPDGDALVYSWDPGDGSPAEAEAVVEHRYERAGAYRPRLTVEDPSGSRASVSVSVLVGHPPTATITEPPVGTTFEPGQTVTFAGEASDTEDGPLPASSLTWTVELHHHAEDDPNHHTHPVLGPITGAGGSFQVPEELHDDDVFFRIHLVAADSDGLPGTDARDVRRP